MERLNSNRLLTWNRPSLSHEPDESISVVHLNIRSYRAHKEDLEADKTIQAAEILALTETYSYRISLEEYQTFSRPSRHGVALLVKDSHTAVRAASMDVTTDVFESVVVYLPNYDITVAVCYIKPNASQQDIHQALLLAD